MIDILYLAHKRREFTLNSLQSLKTSLFDYWNPSSGLSVSVYTDGDYWPFGQIDGRVDHINTAPWGGPVAIMNQFLSKPNRTFSNIRASDIFAKIDNDVIVPPGWLEAALAVMEAHPELEFLGLEPPASRTANPQTGRRAEAPEFAYLKMNTGELADTKALRKMRADGYAPCDSIGGVGLMRRSAFLNRPPMQPSGPRGVGGFTSWQQHNKVRAGWIVPPLKLFLLDRLPFEPWVSLAAQYDASGISRPWTKYDPADAAALWEWWKP